MSRLSRQEMKRDEVREFLSRAFFWVEEHAKQIGLALAAVAVLVLVATVATRLMGNRQDRASDALAEALEVERAPLRSDLSPGVTAPGRVVDTAEQRLAEARRSFEQVVADYPSSKSARVARAYLAKLDLDAGDTESARRIWAELVEGGSRDALNAQLLLNLVTLERRQDAARAEERLLAMVDDPDSLLPQASVLYQLALTQEALGKTEESRSTYRRIVDEYPTSPEARSAAEKAGPADAPA